MGLCGGCGSYCRGLFAVCASYWGDLSSSGITPRFEPTSRETCPVMIFSELISGGRDPHAPYMSKPGPGGAPHPGNSGARSCPSDGGNSGARGFSDAGNSGARRFSGNESEETARVSGSALISGTGSAHDTSLFCLFKVVTVLSCLVKVRVSLLSCLLKVRPSANVSEDAEGVYPYS